MRNTTHLWNSNHGRCTLPLPRGQIVLFRRCVTAVYFQWGRYQASNSATVGAGDRVTLQRSEPPRGIFPPFFNNCVTWMMTQHLNSIRRKVIKPPRRPFRHDARSDSLWETSNNGSSHHPFLTSIATRIANSKYSSTESQFFVSNRWMLAEASPYTLTRVSPDTTSPCGKRLSRTALRCRIAYLYFAPTTHHT